jgi:hypothetical protein
MSVGRLIGVKKLHTVVESISSFSTINCGEKGLQFCIEIGRAVL